MYNLEIAEVHMDQLAICDCSIIRNIMHIAQRTTDPVVIGIINNTIRQLKEIVSEVDMLRASLAMEPIRYSLMQELLNSRLDDIGADGMAVLGDSLISRRRPAALM